MTKTAIQLILLAITITVTLLCNKMFGSASMAAYYYYTITASLFTVVAAALFMANKNTNLAKAPVPFILFVVYTTYVCGNQLLIKTQIDYSGFYMLCNTLLLIGSSLFILQQPKAPQQLYTSITLIAAAEALICLLQAIGWQQSQNHFFTITGTWVNPNVTALFLAMALPANLYILFTSTKTGKIAATLTLISILAALLLLHCRTALIGSSIASILILNHHYQLLHTIKTRYNRRQLTIASLTSIIVITIAAIMLYAAKPTSAQGRTLVWQVSLHLITQKPITGYGYGNFQQQYNIAQAQYFAQHKGTQAQKQYADIIYSAYNDYIQNAVEGGLPGMLIFIMLLSSLLLITIKNKQNTTLPIASAHAGIAAFGSMALFNFTIEAIPAMALFVVYSAVLITHKKTNNPGTHKYIKPIVCTAILVIAGYTGINQLHSAIAAAKSKQASQQTKAGNYTTAIAQLQPLQQTLQTSETYQLNYAHALLAQNNYSAAIEKLEKVQTLSSSIEASLLLGHCYQQTGQYTKAIAATQLATNMVPSRLLPKYKLMNLYLLLKDTASAKKIAQEILNTNTKVKSKESLMYKFRAMQIRKQLDCK